MMTDRLTLRFQVRTVWIGQFSTSISRHSSEPFLPPVHVFVLSPCLSLSRCRPKNTGSYQSLFVPRRPIPHNQGISVDTVFSLHTSNSKSIHTIKLLASPASPSPYQILYYYSFSSTDFCALRE
jgi:hypothetical protein